MQDLMHPSGMTMARWNNPFKTPEERELVIRYNRRTERREKKEAFNALFNSLPEAPF